MSRNLISSIDQLVRHGKSQNVLQLQVDEAAPHGRTIQLGGRSAINFGSCSYLGLEKHPALIEGAVDAVRTYGTQFSSSRSYVSMGLYRQLEEQLRQIFGQPVIAFATTTLGHLATLPVIVEEGDAVILDMQVHSSVQMAAELLKARGIPISIIRHNDMKHLRQKIDAFRVKHKRVWYLADGIYSMYGDAAPTDELTGLLDEYPQLHLYIDDAHGTSWAGKAGAGYVRGRMAHHPRMVHAASLNKGFAAGGGVLIFPNEEMESLVRNCGGTYIFSGPIQPPMLGAACASAALHLDGTVDAMQAELTELIRHTNETIRELDLPQFMETDSPIFFIPSGLPRTTAALCRRLQEDGFFVNPAGFPATPMKRGGVRFMTNLLLSKEDMTSMLERLAYHYPIVMREEGTSCEQIAKTFGIPEFTPGRVGDLLQMPASVVSSSSDRLEVSHYSSIDDLDREEWDEVMGPRGNFTASSLQMLERVFSDDEVPESRWSFHYFTVRDASDHLVLSTFFTESLVKDDMLAPEEVSREVEKRREKEPLYLMSKAAMLGCPISEGEHLYLDRSHPAWGEALRHLLEAMQECDASQLLLREFSGERDEELDRVFMDHGFVRQEMLNVCTIDEIAWDTPDEFVQSLGRRYRSDLRREVLRYEEKFEVVTAKPETDAEVEACYRLYRRVADRSFEINSQQLPLDYFKAVCRHDDYDLIRLYIRDERGHYEPDQPAGVMLSLAGKDTYYAMIVGLDYEVLRSHEVYKQSLYQTALRARELGYGALNLGFTAEAVKKKVGARPKATWMYAQLTDHYDQAVLASMSRSA